MIWNYYKVRANGHKSPIGLHRLRAEIALGKKLPTKAIVHHADGTTGKDSPLVICQDQSYHKLLHIRHRIVKAGGNPDEDAICNQCGDCKPRSSFAKDRSHHNGLSHRCFDCSRVYDRNRCEARRVKRQRDRSTLSEATVRALGIAIRGGK